MPAYRSVWFAPRTARAALASGAFLSMAMAGATGAEAALVVSAGATRNVTCSASVCSATAKGAVLNVAQLQTLLASSSVQVISGSKAGDIEIAAALGWTSTSNLTLDAYHSILVKKPVSVNGAGEITLTTNDGGSGGTLFFGAKANIAFLSTSDGLTINGAAYTLVGDVATLASDVAANANGNYALAANYNAHVDGTYTASPVATTFGGSFQGLGNSISHLAIKAHGKNAMVGLFAQVATGGSVANLGLLHAAISAGKGADVGALVGWNAGAVFGCFVTGRVTARGGEGTNGLPGTGGLVGFNISGSITNSHSAAKVTGDLTLVGGLVGFQEYGEGASISNSYATGTVTGSGIYTAGSAVGGLMGYGGGSISQSFATGAVNAGESSTAGGLVGSTNEATIDNSYSTGAVTSPGGGYNNGTYIGGFSGYNTGSISDSYSTGAPSAPAGGDVGGFTGTGPGTFTDDVWDTTTSGTTVGDGGVPGHSGMTGETTAQLQAGLPPGFLATIWGQSANINAGLPYLLANPPPRR